MIRKILFWSHLVAGCVGGLIILLMSVTGVLLTYERQLQTSAEVGAFTVSGASKLPLEELLNRQVWTATPTITLRSAATAPIEVNRGKAGIVYLDPSSGQELGKPNLARREFFQKVRGWHRWLAWEGEWRTWGKAITGACTLAFVFLVLSGLFIWMPRVWSWKHLRPITWFRSGLSGKARDFNWHNAIGIWSAIPLFFVIISALPISYPWANELIYQVTGTEMPKAANTPAPKGAPNAAGIDRLVEVAKREPGWQSVSFRLEPGEGPITFTVDRGDGGQPQLRSTLTLDRSTATVVKSERFEDFNTGRKVRSFSRFLHTGEALGLLGQTVAGIVSAGGAVLVWTGIALSLRRFSAWRRRQTA